MARVVFITGTDTSIGKTAVTALLPELLEGLDDYVPRLTLQKVPGASHWIVHERPDFVIERLAAFLGESVARTT